MPRGHRRVAFSGKQKKQQMQAKKDRVRARGDEDPVLARATPVSEVILQTAADGEVDVLEETLAINHQPGGRTGTNRYNLKFRKETPLEAEQRKAQHHLALTPHLAGQLEYTTQAFYPPGLDYPKRPPWTKAMSRRELDQSEQRHFRLFCQALEKQFGRRDLSLYELNLETWRQLWRVTEMADVLLVIVDARYSMAQFPPYLYHHLQSANKGVILLLNKCDLVPPAVIVALQDYFTSQFPRLVVVPFSSLEGYGGRGMVKMAAEGALRLVAACESLLGGEVDLSKWRQKIEEERDVLVEGGECEVEEGVVQERRPSTRPEEHQRLRGGILTIGTIGHPNVGKSSLINALMGKKVVSVSKTPGHTKHFQTIFLTRDVRLCDCPGLVFPSLVSMELQVVFGSFPIAQVRDSINVVRYIGSRLDMPSTLRLKHPESTPQHEVVAEWTAYLVCEAWARKRGYFIKRRGSPDASRAANELLRFCLNGYKGLVLYLAPPLYSLNREKFEKDPRTEEARMIQGVHAKEKLAEEPKDKYEECGKDVEEGQVEDEEDMSVDGEEDSNEENTDGEENIDESDDDEDEVIRPTSISKNKFTLLMDDD